MNRRDFIAAAFAAALCAPRLLAADDVALRAAPRVLSFHEAQGAVNNPGIGWQSSDGPSSKDPNRIPSMSEYHKDSWVYLEPEKDRYDLSRVRRYLAEAKAGGQRLSFRLAVVDEQTSAPEYLRTLGVRGARYRYNDGSGASESLWTPDFGDPIFLERHKKLLGKIAEILNSDPDVDYIDIGTVGLWGEWHFGDTMTEDGRKGDALMPPFEVKQKIIDQYLEAFPSKPLVMQVQDPDGLRYAVSKGIGWRGDCLGNMNFQMPRMYPRNLAAAEAYDAWKKGPVAFEVCWDISYWEKQGWSVDNILQWALDQHVSVLNAKSRPLSPAARGSIDRFLKRAGYRLVPTELTVPVEAAAGTVLEMSLKWENRGVAPSYFDFMPAIELRGPGGAVVSLLGSGISVKGMLPGAHSDMLRFDLRSTPQGVYHAHLGLVGPGATRPGARFAVTECDERGWIPLGEITVK